MLNKYLIKDKRIIIYGTGGLSIKLYNLFYAKHIDIECYIDMRAEHIKEHNQKPVYTLDEASRTIIDKESYVIVVATKNVFEHSKIVANLVDSGFRNIIFKSYEILQGEAISDSIDKAFEDILNKGIIPEYDIETIDNINLLSVKNEAFITEDKEGIVVYIPSYLLFTNRIEGWKWSRVNFISSFDTIDMYESFELSTNPFFEEFTVKYIEEFAKEGARHLGLNTEGNWEEFLIEGRLSVYREMEMLLNLNPEFFINNCPFVSGNVKNGFELISSGKNRVAFLISKGYKYVPVKLKEEDYYEFLNKKEIEKFCLYLNNNRIRSLKTLIPHPFFYKYSVDYPDYIYIWLGRITKYIDTRHKNKNNIIDYRDMTIMINCDDDGCANRYFSMLGFLVSDRAESNEKTLHINELLGFSKSGNSTIDFDYSVVFSESFNNKRLLKDIYEESRKSMFVAGKNCEIAEILKEFNNSTEVFTTIWKKEKYAGYRVDKEEA